MSQFPFHMFHPTLHLWRRRCISWWTLFYLGEELLCYFLVITYYWTCDIEGLKMLSWNFKRVTQTSVSFHTTADNQSVAKPPAGGGGFKHVRYSDSCNGTCISESRSELFDVELHVYVDFWEKLQRFTMYIWSLRITGKNEPCYQFVFALCYRVQEIIANSSKFQSVLFH